MFCGFAAYAQNAGKDSSKISTGAKLDGIKYYITIVPGDSSSDQHMPQPVSEGNGFVTVDSPPVPITEVQPIYPDIARRAQVEGTVYVKCLVGKDGKVTRPVVIQTDSPVLDSAAISAALQWRFTPGRLTDSPVAVWTTIPFHFYLKNLKPPSKDGWIH